MLTTIPTWNMPLSVPPTPRQIAIGTHGRRALVERWSGLSFWSLHAYRYSARVRMGEAWVTIEPGCVSIIPPGIDLEFRMVGVSSHTYAHFDLPADAQQTTPVPAVRQMGDAFPRFDADFRQAVGWHARQPARAAARVWELVWRFAGDEATEPTDRGTRHAVIDRAVEWIELHLSEPFTIGQLAEALDVSHVHLVRLFRSHVAQTPLAYIHARRAKRAEHFLRHTSFPMKAIAQQVGLSDLQQLNKLCRKVLGCPPSEIRAGRRAEQVNKPRSAW